MLLICLSYLFKLVLIIALKIIVRTTYAGGGKGNHMLWWECGLVKFLWKKV